MGHLFRVDFKCNPESLCKTLDAWRVETPGHLFSDRVKRKELSGTLVQGSISRRTDGLQLLACVAVFKGLVNVPLRGDGTLPSCNGRQTGTCPL